MKTVSALFRRLDDWINPIVIKELRQAVKSRMVVTILLLFLGLQLLILGFYLLITGMLSLVRIFVDRSTLWLWSLLSGIVGILAGIFVLNHPLLAAVTVPTACPLLTA